MHLHSLVKLRTRIPRHDGVAAPADGHGGGAERHAPNAAVAGVIRTQQNWIGGNDHNPCGADFVPPPPEEVPRLLVDLCEAINDDRLPPLVQAALVHAYVVAVRTLKERWRTLLGTSPGAPRRDAAAWAILEVLSAHPVLTAPAATAATQRATRSIYDAIEQLVRRGYSSRCQPHGEIVRGKPQGCLT